MVTMTEMRRYTAKFAPSDHDPLNMILHGLSYNRVKLVQEKETILIRWRWKLKLKIGAVCIMGVENGENAAF